MGCGNNCYAANAKSGNSKHPLFNFFKRDKAGALFDKGRRADKRRYDRNKKNAERQERRKTCKASLINYAFSLDAILAMKIFLSFQSFCD